MLLAVGIAIGSLVAFPWVFATIRALLGKKQPPFVYPIDVAEAEVHVSAEKYAHRAIVALDIFCNVFILAGRQGETISTHAWIASGEGKIWGRVMNAWLNAIQRDHGPQAASGDLYRGSAEVARMKRLLGVK